MSLSKGSQHELDHPDPQMQRGEPKWKQQIDDWRLDLGCKGFLRNIRPWTTVAPWRYKGINVTQRHLEILDCVALHFLGGAKRAEEILSKSNARDLIVGTLQHAVVDLSQNPIRRAFSDIDGTAKCLTTSSVLYSFSRDRILLPFEKMLLQGHSMTLKIPRSMPNKCLNELAGMGISLPTLGLIFVAMMNSTGL